MLLYMMLSPVAALVVCILFFFGVSRNGKANLVGRLANFFGFLVTGAFLGFGLAVIVIIILMVMLPNNPQGPLAIIYWGPVGISLGMIGSMFLWRRDRIKKT